MEDVVMIILTFFRSNSYRVALPSSFGTCHAGAMIALRAHVQRLCRNNGIQLNTDAGQHFLIDERVLGDIVRLAGIRSEDHVLEIGAGCGILTRALLKHARRVTAIEWDRRWIPVLEAETGARDLPAGTLTIVNANALKVEPPPAPYVVVANIPYHITAPLLRHLFLDAPHPPRRATLLVQREVADKLVIAPPATFLGVLVGLVGKAARLRIVPPSAFLPPPAVDSAVLQIDAHEPPLASRETIAETLRLASAAFAGRRKMLRRTIGAFHGGMERLAAAAIEPTRRPETLSIDEWIALGRA
ncbi:MAG: 16S rRNA (adenine1518-N6/adenine1519-N6)-dimethyltransferase [Candidatus Peregrinibacteria bacterium Gr01-1014_25]|nr:MAG: 16S rRNA (adenine1518-N6/adenine1519-N6)-dimethyltransferase [Candidatus Peregrinibacteria bacterium Gr01-1014_25]